MAPEETAVTHGRVALTSYWRGGRADKGVGCRRGWGPTKAPPTKKRCVAHAQIAGCEQGLEQGGVLSGAPLERIQENASDISWAKAEKARQLAAAAQTCFCTLRAWLPF
eukprot:1159148-Pelagomonas_calceolata.AAC.14